MVYLSSVENVITLYIRDIGSFSQVLSHIPQSHMNWACSVNLNTYFRAVQKVCTQEYCKDHTKYEFIVIAVTS